MGCRARTINRQGNFTALSVDTERTHSLPRKGRTPRTPLLRLYRIGENDVQPVSVEYLNATAPESDFQPETDEPLRESTSRLPAGVFVFLDDLRSFVDWIFPPGCHDGECRDAITLNTSPDLPNEMIGELQEGFVAPKPIEPEGRWLRRQFVDAFNRVREPIQEAKRFPVEAPDERWIELANEHELHVDHWIELVGIGVGTHETYQIGDERVTFIKHTNEFMSDSPGGMQVEMQRDNRVAPQLVFPCTPAELIEFVDTAIGIHCFMVPDAFRLAVVQQNTLPVSSKLAEPTAPALAQNLSPKRGVTKAEILRLEWPMPAKAPSLDSILDKIPKWVSSACNKVGQAGKGVSGSHLWNPAMLAVCLANMTPQKRWRCNKLALTNFMRNNYSDYFSEWEDYAERL